MNWKDPSVGIMALFTLTLVGALCGGISGTFSSGADGFILGGSIGFIIGTVVWAVVTMTVQWQNEQRINRYFIESNRQD